jgi:hypothetical protein
MASGVLGGTGPRPLERRVEPGADEGVERVRVDRQLVSLLAPWAPRVSGGEPGRWPAGRRTRGQHLRRACAGLARGPVPGQPGLPAASRIAPEPVAEGLAMAPQELSHVPAGVGLPTGQEVEPLEPWSLATILCVLQARLEGCRLFTNDR